jgi:hypothetical protein
MSFRQRRYGPRRKGFCAIAGVAVCVFVLPVAAQQTGPVRLTAADYERAEQALGANTNALVLRASVSPSWLPDDRFWYRVDTERGHEFILVDPRRRSREPAFDHCVDAENHEHHFGLWHSDYSPKPAVQALQP